jgi:precorrin-6B methylase 2
LAHRHQADDWNQYQMEWREPHRCLEPAAREIATVDDALAALVTAGILPHADYDHEQFLAMRQAVRQHFDIPWTAITPRLQRLIYAINAIAVGIFCGNTFIFNGGAACGPGACYEAHRLVGIEIRPEEAQRAARNVAAIDPEGRAEIIATDGIPFLRDFDQTIDLLYLDADGTGGQGKSVYLDLIEAARDKLRPGSLILAHNSVNAAEQLTDYLTLVRNQHHCRTSVNVVLDDQGLEVSLWTGAEKSET